MNFPRVCKRALTTHLCVTLWTLSLGPMGLAQVYPEGIAPRDREFVEACIYGNVEKATEMLNLGANPKLTLPGGITALHWAAVGGHDKIVQLLISRGVNVNARDETNRSPLVEAAGSHNPHGMKLLLQAGAQQDGSELRQACWLGRLEHIKLLLDAGGNPDHGIASAAQGGHLEVMKLLLEKGAKVEGASDAGGKLLGNSPLHLAASQGGLKAVELLLEKKANPNAVNGQGQTPLHKAITGNGDLESVKRLVAAGAKLDIADEEGFTPVRLQGMRGGGPIYEFLLAVNDGKEPAAKQPAAPVTSQGGRSTKELIAVLTAGDSRPDYFMPQDREAHLAAQRELALRGRAVMPDVLQAIDGGAALEPFHGLLTALGPQAEGVLPVLATKLQDQERVILVAMTMERIKPGALKELPQAANQAAADSIYSWIVNNGVNVGHGVALGLLTKTGISKLYILRLMRHEDAAYRRLAAIHLGKRPTPDVEIEAEMEKLSNDADPHVRQAAIRALERGKMGKP